MNHPNQDTNALEPALEPALDLNVNPFQDQPKNMQPREYLLKLCHKSVSGEVIIELINRCNKTFMHFQWYKTLKQFDCGQTIEL